MEKENKINFSDKEKRQTAYLEKNYRRRGASGSEQEDQRKNLSTVSKHKGGKIL